MIQKIFIKTFGCQMNEYDSNRIYDTVKKIGFEKTDRYEELNEGHHDHLIDIKSGEIIEFVDEEIEKLQKKVAEKYGYKLVDHKLELYGIKKKS